MVTKKNFIFVVVVLSLGTISAYGQMSSSTDAVKVQGTDYSVSYVMTSGQITDIIAHTHSKSLIILANGTGNSIFTITLPRDLIDAKIGDRDSAFMVTDDGLPVEFQESKTNMNRTLTISFSYKSNPEIFMITGTHVVPEFGPVVSATLVIAILSVLIVIRRINTSLQFKRSN